MKASSCASVRSVSSPSSITNSTRVPSSPICRLQVDVSKLKGFPSIERINLTGMHGMVAEGVLTTNAAVGLAQRMGVEMPITQQMHAILQQGKSVQDAIRDLMRRPSTSEVGLYRN